MSHPPTTSHFPSGSGSRLSLRSRIIRVIRVTFIHGPKVLLTSQITGLCASLMILLCLPSLLYCAMLTVPGMLFYSPEQNAYYYFAKVLNEDPGRWIVLAIAAACVLIAVALPATMPEKAVSIDD